MSLWRRRRISNLEYLIWLNLHAGRRLGDRAAHAFVPWVLDFSAAPTAASMAGGGGVEMRGRRGGALLASLACGLGCKAQCSGWKALERGC
jgi:WD repeat-containing protein 81